MHLMFESSKRVGSRPNFWDELKGHVVSLWVAHRTSAARRRSLVRLADMEEWQLRDIGLTRADVERALASNHIGRDLVEPVQPH